MSSEDMWKAAHFANEAADKLTRAADRIEEAQRKLTFMFEDGHGGKAIELIESIDQLELSIHKLLERKN